jgi:hypothetical protein
LTHSFAIEMMGFDSDAILAAIRSASSTVFSGATTFVTKPAKTQHTRAADEATMNARAATPAQ